MLPGHTLRTYSIAPDIVQYRRRRIGNIAAALARQSSSRSRSSSSANATNRCLHSDKTCKFSAGPAFSTAAAPESQPLRVGKILLKDKI
jgi:hypothetical protein